MTVGLLIQTLQLFSEDLPIVAVYDCRCAGGSVVTVEIGPGPDNPRESVILVVE
jgi:hypothetical protein